jgi:site-specific recombinase XerD
VESLGGFSMSSNPDILQDFAGVLTSHDPKTVKAYLSAIRGFMNWFIEQPGNKQLFSPEQITETAIRGYLDQLTINDRKPRTRNQVLTALRRFCRWAISEGYMTRNPANEIRRPMIVNVAPRELTPEQRYVLKNRVEIEQSPRLSAIFALGYWAGLRVSEVSQLQVKHCHVNQRSGQITIRDSKSGKTRTIDLHREARRALYDYLQKTNIMRRDVRDPDSIYVFTSQRAGWLRQQGRPDHLTTRGITHIWTTLKQKAPQHEYTIIYDTTFHDLRHDFAHRARAAGWKLEEIAVYLGHQTRDGLPAIATTVRYTLPNRQQLKKKLQQLPG